MRRTMFVRLSEAVVPHRCKCDPEYDCQCFDPDEGWYEYEIGARWEICPECDGEGQHGHPAYEDGWTASEWQQEDSDFQRDYLAGRYDVNCEGCKGTGKLLVPNPVGKREQAIFDAWAEEQQADADYERERAAERRMGY